MPSLLTEAARYDRLIKRFEIAVREHTMVGSYAKEDRAGIEQELRAARKALRNFVQR